MKSKTKIKSQIRKKTNSNLVETLRILNKSKNKELINILSFPRRKKVEVNIDKINKESKDSDIVIIPGKVLSLGNMEKKIKVIALSFSKEAKKKLEESKCDISLLSEELKKNKDIKGKIIV
jgi:large subunit ribosomal protein L18e